MCSWVVQYTMFLLYFSPVWWLMQFTSFKIVLEKKIWGMHRFWFHWMWLLIVVAAKVVLQWCILHCTTPYLWECLITQCIKLDLPRNYSNNKSNLQKISTLFIVIDQGKHWENMGIVLKYTYGLTKKTKKMVSTAYWHFINMNYNVEKVLCLNLGGWNHLHGF